MSNKVRVRGEGVLLPCSRCQQILPHEQFPDTKTRGKIYVNSHCRKCKNIMASEAAARRRKARREAKGVDPQISCARYDYAMARMFLNYTHEQTIEWLSRGCKKHPETIMRWVDGVDCENELEWLNTDVGDDALAVDGMQPLRPLGK